MLFLDDVKFLERFEEPLDEYLIRAVKHVNALQFCDENTIRSHCDRLKTAIGTFVQESPIYTKHTGTITKNNLLDKDKWYVKGYAADKASTSGSSTGEHFEYLRWSDTFLAIEKHAHYLAILDEFKISESTKILYLMLDTTEDRNTNELIKIYRTDNILISHGQQQRAVVYEVIKNKKFFNDYYGFYEDIIQFLNFSEIDIIICQGNVAASLTWNLKRLKHDRKICKLLSNTGYKVNHADLNFLKENQLIDNWCDHMRCWDGGVTFYSCQFNKTHLIDGLAWAWSDAGRLISTDFYSLPSPFVNYWNGDYCTIAEQYQICKCGRCYRPFEMQSPRSVAVNNAVSDQLKVWINQLPFIADIKRAEATRKFIRVFTKRPLTSKERAEIRKVLQGFEVNCVTEDG